MFLQYMNFTYDTKTIGNLINQRIIQVIDLVEASAIAISQPKYAILIIC